MRPTAQRLMLHFATAREPINRATEPSAGGHPPSLQKQSWASGVHTSGSAQGIWGPGECTLQQALWHRRSSTLSRQREAIHRACRRRAGRQASSHPGQHRVSGVRARRTAQATHFLDGNLCGLPNLAFIESAQSALSVKRPGLPRILRGEQDEGTQEAPGVGKINSARS